MWSGAAGRAVSDSQALAQGLSPVVLLTKSPTIVISLV